MIKKKDNNSIFATIIKIIKNIFELVNRLEKSIFAFPYSSEFTVLVKVKIDRVNDDLKSMLSKIKKPDNKNKLAKNITKIRKATLISSVTSFLFE